MGRVLWMGVGAVGGIYAYRKGERAYRTVQEQGLTRTTQVLITSTVGALASMRAVEEQPRAAATTVDRQHELGASPGPAGLEVRIGSLRISRAATAPAAPRPAISDTGTVPGEPTGQISRRKAR